MSFPADYPWAIVWPAHPTNWYDPANHGGVPNRPRAFCLHTPEEPAGDNYPGTPIWFAGPNRNGSTHYFVEAIEDPNRPGFCKVYQCVPESFGAIANGKTADKPWPAWADRNTSLNWQTLSVEIEGYAHSIHQTLTPMQLKTVAHLVAHRAAHYGFPTDRSHVFGHYEVSNQRTDPGARFPWDELIAMLAGGLPEEPRITKEDDDMAVVITEPGPVTRAYLVKGSLMQWIPNEAVYNGLVALYGPAKGVDQATFDWLRDEHIKAGYPWGADA